MKAYRVEVITRGKTEYEGLFAGMWFDDMGIADGLYEELMYPINDGLKVPDTLKKPKEFWFTQKGWDDMKGHISKLISVINEHSGGYFKNYRVLVTEMEYLACLSDVVYQDEQQVGLNRVTHQDSRLIPCVMRFYQAAL